MIFSQGLPFAPPPAPPPNWQHPLPLQVPLHPHQAPPFAPPTIIDKNGISKDTTVHKKTSKKGKRT